MAFVRDLKISRLVLLIFLMSLPVLAQEIVFTDSFESLPASGDLDKDGLLNGEEEDHGTDPRNPDTDGDGFGDGSEVAVGTDPLDKNSFPLTPVDPMTIAPDPEPGVITTVHDSTSFLYTGNDAIQTGVAPETIDLHRAAVIRGKVMTRNGAPLPLVTVSILNHPEFGQTISRADGMFDLVVNGGDALVVDYHLEGFLPSQRRLDVPWQQYINADDVALVQLDPAVTTIDLNAPGDMKIARGSIVTDEDGSRQATMLFPAGVSAELVMPDGSTQAISSLNVRATEYTVGDRGAEAMPGDLPPTSAYTYAVELSVDEAMSLGATSVDFNQPIPFYVDNFLGFPAGTPVPTAYYDRSIAAWVPAHDGRVIKILDASGIRAEIDVDGDDIADGGAALEDLGITLTELEEIAGLYSTGQSIWRVPVKHFTPWDHNWPFGPPGDAAYPERPPPVGDTIEQCIMEVPGSIVECQNQILGERLPVTGTPFTLNYRSDRVFGRASYRTAGIQLTGDSPPVSLKRVELDLVIAGREFNETFEPGKYVSNVFTWDGLDAYGRKLQGQTNAQVRIGYVYDGVYGAGGSGAATFGQTGRAPIEGSRTREEVTLPQEYSIPLGVWEAKSSGLGGWTLDVHHSYDPVNKVLYRGDGKRRSAEALADGLTRFAGTVRDNGWGKGCVWHDDPGCGDGLPARQAAFGRPMHTEFTADGTMYIADFEIHRVRRINPDGIVENFAGTGETYRSNQDGSLGPNGDGGPAELAKLDRPYSIAADSMGNIYIGEQFTRRIRKVDVNGIISTYAGGGSTYPPVGPAKEVRIWPLGMEAAADGNLYITDICFVIRIDTQGQSSIVAGDIDKCGNYSGDGGPALQAGLNAEGLDLGPDGSIYVADSGNYRVRRIGKDGVIQTVAGNGTRGTAGDGGAAVHAEIDYLYDIAVDADGGIYLPEAFNSAVRYVDQYGSINKVAGGGKNLNEVGYDGPAIKAWAEPYYIELGPDGLPYFSESTDIITVLRSAMAGLKPGETLIPSEDGSVVYKFSASGRHLQTLHSLTGTALLDFGYDEKGRLNSVTDGDGKMTIIQRNASGVPALITGPFGHTTSLSVDANGFINSISNPTGEQFAIISTPGGLITQTTDPRGRISSYQYDELGRLVSQVDNTGYSQTFARTETGTHFEISRDTGLGRTVAYDVQRNSGNSMFNTSTAPDGSQSSSRLLVKSGEEISTSPTGVESSISKAPDPRFGMQSVFVGSAEVKVPGGPTITATNSSDVELSNPSDPLSVVTLSSTSTLNGDTTLSTYSGSNRVQSITSPAGRMITVEIDELGRLVSRQYGDLAPLTASYNVLGQLETLTSGTGDEARISSFTYGADGFRETIMDSSSRSVSLERDAAGRITSKTLPDNVSVDFAYDVAGDLIGMTPPGRPEHGFTYTRHGQIESITSPTVAGSGSTSYTYNSDRQITTILRPGDQSISYDYDDNGRVRTITLAESSVIAATYTFDYFTGNQLASVTGPGTQKVEFSYLGDLITGVTWTGGLEGSFTRSFDDALRVSSEAVNDEPSIAFSYDADDLLIGADTLIIARNSVNGLAQSATLGVVADSWSYNSFGEITHHTVSANATPVYAVDFTLDKLGRITQKIETIEGLTDTYDYEYDLRGQLLQVKQNTIVVESYTYDDNGNRLTAMVGGVDSSAAYDDQDRLVTYAATTYEYTPSGILITRTRPTDQVTSYDYDIIGNLHGVVKSDATEINYQLDGPDRRIQRSVDGSITHRFLHSGMLPVAQLDASGNLVSQFVYAGPTVPALMIRDGVRYRLVTDQVGSVRLVVNGETGAIAQRIDYDSFGNVLVDTNPGFQPFGFAGGFYDPETGLVRFGFRDYDPETGRWTSQDPVGFNGNDSNLYRYANNNPINLKDVSGLSGWDTFRGFLDGFNQGVQEALNPALAIQHGIEALTDYLLGDWLDKHGLYRDPNPGKLIPPPAGVDPGDYADGEFYGSCTAAVGSMFIGGAAGAPAIAGKIGSLAGKLKQLPGMAKRLAEGAKGLFKRAKPRELPQAVDEVADAAEDFLEQMSREGFNIPGDEVQNLGGMRNHIGDGKFGGGAG